jgi:UDPglucose 6-dehydrogenase
MNLEPLYKVGIIGHGVVGKGIEKLLGEYVVAIYDPSSGYSDKRAFEDLDLVVVCVPTPTDSDGISCDVSVVQRTLLWLRQINFKGVVLLKSTIPPTEIIRLQKEFPLRIVFSPEYMGESKYYTPFWKYPDPSDMRTHMWQIFGGKREDTELCIEVFKRKMSVDTQYFQTDLITASLAKYIENSFFATKVTFINEWYDVAQTYGVDWNELRELWLSDPRINRNHTLVFPKDRGYGGKCYPKDIKAIISDTKKMGYSTDLMRSVDKINNKFRKMNS